MYGRLHPPSSKLTARLPSAEAFSCLFLVTDLSKSAGGGLQGRFSASDNLTEDFLSDLWSYFCTLIRQYDLMTNCIEIGLQFDHTAFDKYMIWALNHVAVACGE